MEAFEDQLGIVSLIKGLQSELDILNSELIEN